MLRSELISKHDTKVQLGLSFSREGWLLILFVVYVHVPYIYAYHKRITLQMLRGRRRQIESSFCSDYCIVYSVGTGIIRVVVVVVLVVVIIFTIIVAVVVVVVTFF